MAVQNKTTIKTYFQTGDLPTEGQFVDLIDSYQNTNQNLSAITSAVGSASTGGMLRFTSASAAVLSPSGTVGLQLLACITSASAQNIIGSPISLPLSLSQGGTGVSAAVASAAFNAVAAQGGTVGGALNVAGIVSADNSIFSNVDVTVSGNTTTGRLTVDKATLPTNGMYLAAANTVGFSTNSTHRQRIDQDGFVTINNNGATPTASQVGIRLSPDPWSGATVFSGGNSSGSQTHIIFVNANNTVGSIVTNGSNTAYNTSSDKTKKEHMGIYTNSGSVIDNIDVNFFRWKSDNQEAYGLYAQDVYNIVPHAVTVDNVNGWSIDYSKFVPDLLAEVKSLRQRMAALEA